MDFGQMVRELRTRNGLTQDELATRLDLSPAAIGAWENGRAKPRLGKIHELADLFGITVSELMGESSHLDVVGGQSAPVPLVATSHMGDAADDEEPDRVVRFPLEVVERHPGCFAVRAEGGCMDKRYVSGSVLLIDPHMQPKTDDAVMARFQDGRSVVRVYMPGSSVLMLSPDSWSGVYEDIIIRPDDDPVELAGVVVFHMAEADIVR